MSFTTDSIRNIALTGHVSTGKTSLNEMILYNGGSISRPEPVETGKSVSDYTKEEIEKGISIYTTLSHTEWNNQKINILDTPGSSDFVGQVIAGLRAAETACICVAAEAGVQIETIKIWRILEERNLPRVVFINKMEKERASFSTCLEDLKDKFNANFVPFTIPIGESTGYKGIVDVMEEKAYMVPESGKKESASDIPDDMKDAAAEYKNAIIETAAEGDDALMEKYFEEGTLSREDIIKGLKAGLAKNTFVPVLCGSATANSGMKSFLDCIAVAAPSPMGLTEKGKNSDDQDTEVIFDSEKSFSGFVFTTSIDQFAGKMSFIKIVTGKLTADSDIYNVRAKQKERTSKIYTALGKKLDEVNEISAGDIAVLTKLGDVSTNDSLSTADNLISYNPLKVPYPVHALTIKAVNKKDEDKLNQFLQRAAEEDMTFKINYNTETKENVISGMGELQINIILDQIKESQKIEMETKVPKVAYRETITKAVNNVEYTHKKQTGGHGQFGRVIINIKPLSRGDQYQFENLIKGGSVSRGYMPGIEKGLHDAMEAGVLAGYPVVDVGISIIDGKEHPVDSSEMSFRLAAKGALKDAISKSNPVLLEPVMNLRVFVDEQYLGDVLSDLSSRRGKVQGQEQLGGGIIEVDAQVPQAELLRYSIDLRSITSGTASFEMDFDHYDPISGKIADAVIAASKREQENED